MEELWAGAGQLPEQVSPDQRLGRSVHQGQGAHQQRDSHETLPILQGKSNGGPLTVEKFIFHLTVFHMFMQVIQILNEKKLNI